MWANDLSRRLAFLFFLNHWSFQSGLSVLCYFGDEIAPFSSVDVSHPSGLKSYQSSKLCDRPQHPFTQRHPRIWKECSACQWGSPVRYEYRSISQPIQGPWSHVSTCIALLATSPGHIGDRKEVAEQKHSRCSSSVGHRGSLLPQHLAHSARRSERRRTASVWLSDCSMIVLRKPLYWIFSNNYVVIIPEQWMHKAYGSGLWNYSHFYLMVLIKQKQPSIFYSLIYDVWDKQYVLNTPQKWIPCITWMNDLIVKWMYWMNALWDRITRMQYNLSWLYPTEL